MLPEKAKAVILIEYGENKGSEFIDVYSKH